MKFYIVNLHDVRWPLYLNKAMGKKKRKRGPREGTGWRKGGRERKKKNTLPGVKMLHYFTKA